MGKYEEYIGQTLNEWTILDYIGKKSKNPYMRCKCSCGKEKEVSFYSIKSGRSKSCGHLARQLFKENNPNPLKNEVGNKHGRLTVLSRVEKEGETRAFWLCRCDCGNEIIVSGKDLRNGHTSSCGCYRKEFLQEAQTELFGLSPELRFGKLVTIEKVGQDNFGNYLWKCKCDCGNFAIVSTHSLKSGTQSCGCLSSKGELRIGKILTENNVNFKKQYTFDDLKINNGKARFDFAIFDNNDNLKCLIEYQGIQHTDKNNKWYRPESDYIKKLYCKENNINLIEINYQDYNKINWNYLKEKCNL